MTRRPLALAVVMPVYNEEASVGAVVSEWMAALDALREPFVLLALDDGSRDGTLPALCELGREFPDRVIVASHANRGHGQTCLEGYRQASRLGARHMLQIDSDGQCDPRFLSALWDLKDHHSVVYGVRVRREDGMARRVASRALRGLLKVRFKVNCPDANVPYRLMRTEDVIAFVNTIPSTVDLANIALSVLLATNPGCSHAFVPITFRRRRGGQPSVSWRSFAGKALGLHRDLRALLEGRTSGAGVGADTTSRPRDPACP
jgi:dolichol-phosphate mannosyltransferase